jgi:glutamate---cysteine ligase / carboxylate-amine ligase
VGQSVTDPYAVLDAAPGIYDSSRDLTCAVEEEFQILDAQTLALTNRFEELKARCDAQPWGEHVAGELIASEIEIKTGRCESFDEAAVLTAERRRALFGEADALGLELCATGCHPWSPWQEQKIIDTPHYRLVEGTLRYVAWRNNTFGMHLHVGVNGTERAIQLSNALRHILPDLLALSCSSPWYERRVTGLHSTRTQLFTKMFPRCGIPDAFESWDEYARFVRFLLDTGSIREQTQIWWCVRPHQAFGTVELRNADGMPDVRESIAVAAFGYAMSAYFLRLIDEGTPIEALPGRYLEENQWRAIRFGLSGDLIDLGGTMTAVPAAERIRRLLAAAAPEIQALGLEPHLRPVERMLEEGNCAQRLLRAIEGGATLEEAFAGEVRATRESALVEEVGEAHG